MLLIALPATKSLKSSRRQLALKALSMWWFNDMYPVSFKILATVGSVLWLCLKCRGEARGYSVKTSDIRPV